MSKVVYSHRIQAILKQCVVDLGLTVAFSDEKGAISLQENEKLFADAANALSLNMKSIEEDGSSTLIFRKR